MITKAFIEAIRNESLGFSFGKPWRYGENSISCVLPIIRVADGKRDYLTFEESKKVEVKDTGSISEAVVTNNEDKPVFIRMGTILKGATQERSTTLGRVILPGATTEIKVVCVHRTKGIATGAFFNYGGYTPQRDGHYLTAMHTKGLVSQSTSWAADTGYTTNYRMATENVVGRITPVPTKEDDLATVVADTKEVFKDVIKKMPLHDNQIGISLIDTKGMHSLECYDLYASWKTVKEEIAGKEALSLSQEDKAGVFEYKPKRAKAAVKEVLKQGYSEKVQVEFANTKTITMDYGKYVGETVLLDDDVIHLMVARKEG